MFRSDEENSGDQRRKRRTRNGGTEQAKKGGEKKQRNEGLGGGGFKKRERKKNRGISCHLGSFAPFSCPHANRIETYRERRAETAGLTAILVDRAKAILLVRAGRGSCGGSGSGCAEVGGRGGRGGSSFEKRPTSMVDDAKESKKRAKETPPRRADLAFLSLGRREERRCTAKPSLR